MDTATEAVVRKSINWNARQAKMGDVFGKKPEQQAGAGQQQPPQQQQRVPQEQQPPVGV